MTDDIGKLIVRLTVGGLLLPHGVHKLLEGIAPIKQMAVAHGLPEMLAFGVYLGEIAAPVLVIVGLFTRAAGLLIAANMIVAVALARMGSVAALGPQGGYALELELFYLASGLAIAFLGAGRFSIGGAGGQLN